MSCTDEGKGNGRVALAGEGEKPREVVCALAHARVCGGGVLLSLSGFTLNEKIAGS